MANTALPYSSLAVLVTHFITRATPIDDIDGKNHKTELKSSRKNSTNHTKSKSRHLLFMASGAYTHTHKALAYRCPTQKGFQEIRHAGK